MCAVIFLECIVTLFSLFIVMVRTAGLRGWWFKTQAFPASGADNDAELGGA